MRTGTGVSVSRRVWLLGLLPCLILGSSLTHAQPAPQGPPRVIPFSGTLTDATGHPTAGPSVLVFAIYADDVSGDPLWSETQVVQPDTAGRYRVLLGSLGDGVPAGIFLSSEARWLGVRREGDPEHPRVQLVSVPYALKAADADTLGGLPASSFVRSSNDGAAVAYEGTAQNSGNYLTWIGSGALFANTSGYANSALGYLALNQNTTGSYNTALGTTALHANNVGSSNTAVGYSTLGLNSAGASNTAIGDSTMAANSTGSYNTAVGANAMTSSTTGNHNVAVGASALASNTTASNNVAVGTNALTFNTTGTDNVAVGTAALESNTTGTVNHALGRMALQNNLSGNGNVAIGYVALGSTTTGGFNIGIGNGTLDQNTTGYENVAAGANALGSNTTGFRNVATGTYALGWSAAGSNNIALGHRAGYNTTGSNNILVGNEGIALEDNAIYLGSNTHTKTVLQGNVGIGTTAPAQKLHVAGTGSTYVNVASSGGSAGLVLSSSASSAHLWSKSADGAFVLENPLGTTRMVVTADGRLGVGTAAPAQAFELLGGGSQYVNLWSTAGNAGFVLTAGGHQGIVRENVADGSLAMENPNGTERFRITSGGYVGIGTAAPAHPLQMASGAHVTAGGAWTNASSRTLKDQIADIPADEAVAAVSALRPVTFVYRAEPSDTQAGFIAEDVPPLVATPDRASLSPMDLVAVAIRVIQEQQRQLDELRARVAELERRATAPGPLR